MAQMDELRTEIITIASAICACTEDERELLGKLCGAAEEEINSSLREDVTVEDCTGVYVCAAAWLAASALELTRGGEDVAAMRAGDLTIRRRSAQEREVHSRQLREQAWKMLAPYTKERGFCFRGVRG